MDSILGNIIGSFIAVAGAIGLLFLAEWYRHKEKRDELEKNFLRELRYIKEMVESCKSAASLAIERLGVGSDIFFTYEPASILSQSIQKAYQEGLLYDRLAPEQIAKLNIEVLSFFGVKPYPIDQYVRDRLNDWKSNKITQQDLYGTFTWIQDAANSAVKLISQIEKEFVANRKKSK